MTLKIHCPNPDCKQGYNIQESDLGRKATCRKCGLEFRPNAGPRESQLSTQASDTTPPTIEKPRATAPTKLGRFEIRARLGAGAFGVVYRAYDPTLDREVALKVPHPGRLQNEKDKVRFLREGKTAAKLRHPNIVPVYDAGVDGQYQYIAAAFIEGRTLQTALDEEKFDLSRSVQLVRDLAGALYYAHRLGVVHRDVKPANIMLDANGDPLLMDFGLARFQEDADKLTHDGTLLGTPAYMAPEQARGDLDNVRPASDQYSLGVVLYELLCGEVPFSGPPALVISHVINEEPPRPGTEHPERKIPRDLETICLKAMSKKASERYENCAVLAEDLRCWQSGEPIHARPIGKPERLWRWCKRNPVVAGLSAAAAILLLLVAVTASFGYVKTSRALTAADESLVRETSARYETEEQRRRAEANAKRADKEAAEAEKKTEMAEQNLYYVCIALANQKRISGEIEEAEKVLDACPVRFRGWEWDYLKRLSHLNSITLRGHSTFVTDVAFSPDGKRLVICSGDGMVKIWDTSSDREVNTFNEMPAKVLIQNSFTKVAFSPDGTRLAVAINDPFANPFTCVKILNSTTGQEVLRLHRVWSRYVAFSPNGKQLAAGNKVWDTSNGQELLTLGAPQSRDFSVAAFSPDGKRLVSCCDNTHEYNTAVKIWDTSNGDELLTFHGHRFQVPSVAFSPDGKHLASAGSEGTVKIWDSISGQELLTLRGHLQRVLDLVFNPDGKYLATASADKTVKIWNANSGNLLLTLRWHKDLEIITSVAFSPDGKRLATGSGVFSGDMKMTQSSADNTAKIWDISCIEGVVTLRGSLPPQSQPPSRSWVISPVGAPMNTSNARCVAFNPDGKLIARVFSGTATIWDTCSGQEVRTFKAGRGLLQSVAFSPDSKQLAATTDGKVKVYIWDVASGQELLTLAAILPDTHGDPPVLAYNPNGKHVAVGSAESVKIYDVSSGMEVLTLPVRLVRFQGDSSARWKYSIGFDSDGKRLAVGGWGIVAIWDVVSRPPKPLVTLQFDSDHAVNSIAFSPDGKRLATGDSDRTTRVYDAASGQELLTLGGHTAEVSGVAFHPDGKRLATSSSDNTVRIWDVTNGQELLALSGNSRELFSATFSPDGKRLAAGSDDNTVMIWDATLPANLNKEKKK